MGSKKISIKIYDMSCTSCEERITRVLSNLNGVLYARASYSKSLADIEFDDDICSKSQIEQAIHKIGYSTTKSKSADKVLGIIIVVLAIVLLGGISLNYDVSAKLNNATYLVLILIGAISSLHCVGMCGGIMLSQSITGVEKKGKYESVLPAISYNCGRILSYTILGGIVGALGSVISLSPVTRAMLQIAAGLFMIIMGLNMIGLSWFRKIHIKLPWSACKIKQRSRMPFVVGLLNGLMPCGPLQTMQLFALGTGSMVKGAASMFFFSIGTVPLMLTFGAVSGMLSSGSTKKILKFSGVLVMSLGIIMGGRGLNIMGLTFPSIDLMPKNFISRLAENDDKGNVRAEVQGSTQTVQIKVTAQGYNPSTVVVQRDIPLKIIVIGEQITSCNNTFLIPVYKVERPLQKGENIIELKPTAVGDIKFSCSMGMLSGTIKVVENLQTTETGKNTNQEPIELRRESIYGKDLSIVPSYILVKPAEISFNIQKVKIVGIGYEFKPLVAVLSKGLKSKVTIDLSYFESPVGMFDVVEGSSGKIIKSFKGKQGIINLEIPTSKVGSYGIFKGDRLLFIFDVVGDSKNVNLDDIKKKFID